MARKGGIMEIVLLILLFGFLGIIGYTYAKKVDVYLSKKQDASDLEKEDTDTQE